MTKTFRQALIEWLDSTNIPLAVIAKRAEVSYEQLKKVTARETASTNFDDAVKVAHAFGVTVDEFLEDDLASDRAAIAKLYTQLSPSERRLLRAAAKGLPSVPHEADQ
jgi:hypothetical protein